VRPSGQMIPPPPPGYAPTMTVNPGQAPYSTDPSTLAAGQSALNQMGMNCAQWNALSTAQQQAYVQPLSIVPDGTGTSSPTLAQGVLFNIYSYCVSQGATQGIAPPMYQAPISVNSIPWGWLIVGGIAGFFLSKIVK
jgi:hypothetical protein